MTSSTRKNLIRTIAGGFGGIVVFIILLLHNAWGDERYEQKDEAIRKEIRRIDTQLTIKDTEILFAESAREKEKFIAIKAIYERNKDALKVELKD